MIDPDVDPDLVGFIEENPEEDEDVFLEVDGVVRKVRRVKKEDLYEDREG